MSSEIGHRLKHPKKAAMLAAIAKTGNISASARAADIERSTHYKWIRSDPEYAAATDQALEVAVDVLEAVARKRAIIGSDTLLIFLLKAARPERYRDRYQVEHAGKVKVEPMGDPFTLLRDPILVRALDEALVRREMGSPDAGGDENGGSPRRALPPPIS